MKSLIVGHGGREAALGTRMSESSTLYGFMGHANPTICRLSAQTGGAYYLGDVRNGKEIARFATEHSIDIAMVSSDDPLEAGVVDQLRSVGIPTVGPTRAGSEIEWNKMFCRSVVNRIAPKANPIFGVAQTVGEIEAIVNRIAEQKGTVVVKPVGLSGGKGVKVVGPHLDDNAAAIDYAKEIIISGRHGGIALIEEKIDAPEFTIQAMTDGKTVVFPPATYDYPYRFDGDKGPGTGGMGSCALSGGLFPFLNKATYDQACEITQDVIDFLAKDNRSFSGCLNAGFFVTDEGLRVIEFNARFGDPEGINIMALLDSDWIEIMHAMQSQSLHERDLKLIDKTSIVKYLVAPEYALGTSTGHKFSLDVEVAHSIGANVLFSSAIETGPKHYQTVGTSRAVAITAEADTVQEANAIISQAISDSFDGDLQWRNDIGSFPSKK